MLDSDIHKKMPSETKRRHIVDNNSITQVHDMEEDNYSEERNIKEY